MARVRKIIALSLAAVFLVTLTVYAGIGDWFTFKVRQNGTVVSIRTWECFKKGYGASQKTATQKAYLRDSRNKALLAFKEHRYKSIGTRKGNYSLYSYFPYEINMYRYKPGKYSLLIRSYSANFGTQTRQVPFTYTGGTVLRYHSSKLIRNNNGELVQRFFFKRANANGKMFHAQIFNSRNKLVRSYRFKSGRSNQLLGFNWNGWPSGNSVNRCPRGVYTVKYWFDGLSPRTAKFRMAL